jgi:hypothetical protein
MEVPIPLGWWHCQIGVGAAAIATRFQVMHVGFSQHTMCANIKTNGITLIISKDACSVSINQVSYLVDTRAPSNCGPSGPTGSAGCFNVIRSS